MQDTFSSVAQRLLWVGMLTLTLTLTSPQQSNPPPQQHWPIGNTDWKSVSSGGPMLAQQTKLWRANGLADLPSIILINIQYLSKLARTHPNPSSSQQISGHKNLHYAKSLALHSTFLHYQKHIFIPPQNILHKYIMFISVLDYVTYLSLHALWALTVHHNKQNQMYWDKCLRHSTCWMAKAIFCLYVNTIWNMEFFQFE